MAKALIIYAHPNESSFCRAIADSAQEQLESQGYQVELRDLYRLGFQSVLSEDDFVGLQPDVKAEQDALREAETLIVVYPIWWYGPPAIFKGWLDRVFQKGFAFDYDQNGLKGLLSLKNALLLATTGGTDEELSGDLLDQLLSRPITDGAFRFCRVPNVNHKIFYNVGSVDEEARQAMLDEVKTLVQSY